MCLQREHTPLTSCYYLLMDSLGGRFQDLEPTLWRKVLALVSSGADAHDAVLSALADVVRPAWACAACTLANPPLVLACVACGATRPPEM